MNSCLMYGMHVRSEIPLYVERPVPAALPVDLTVTVGEGRTVGVDRPEGHLLAECIWNERKLFTFVTTDDGSHLLRFHGSVDFAVSADLSRVIAHVDPSAEPGIEAVLLTGTLMSFIIMMAGEPLLHASAVEIGGGALAFVGYAGMGKSTMATIMCANGALSITDDVLRLDMTGGDALCHLGANESRLRKGATELSAAFDDAPLHRRTGDERDALRLRASTTDLLPLRAIVFPQPTRDTDSVVVHRLEGTKALLAMSAFPRILGWEDAATQARQFQHLADLVERVPTFAVLVPWGPPFAPDIAAQVLDGIGFVDELAAVR